MNVSDSVSIAMTALTANKVRSVLTMLGMIIGVSAVIALLSLGRGVQQTITDQFSSLGTNLLFIQPGAQSEGGVQTATGTVATLTLEDASAIAESTPLISGVTAQAYARVQIVYASENVNTRVTGTTPDYPFIRNAPIAIGDFIAEQDVIGSTSVMVLGDNVARSLFGTSDPIGQTVRVNTGRINLSFRIIGVMERKGGASFGNEDDQVFVPVTTLAQKMQGQRTVGGERRIDEIDVQVADKLAIEEVTAIIGELLRDRHRVIENDFTILSQEQILQTVNTALGAFTILLGSIAGISLLVGGIGIMNIMLVSVTERTREIGIRKAMGAKRQDIMMQFLVEAVVVSGIGGGLGVLVGIGFARLANGFSLGETPIRTAVGLDSVLLAFVVSAGIGIFFGLYPAVRAARLNPIDALRYE